MRQYLLCCLAALAWYGAAGRVQAVDYFWNNVNGGAFDEPSHWTPLSPPATQGPGGPGDTVNFDLGFPGRYKVTDADRENSQLIVHNDRVELTLFIDYELSSAGGVSPSLVVGAANGDVGDLWITAGGASQLTTQVTRIANAAGSVGELRVSDFDWDGGNLRVGYEGEGTLQIDDETIVTSSNASLAHLTGSIGHARVDGIWNTGGNFLVGREGVADLSVLTSGQITSSVVSLGVESSGAASVFHLGSWSVAGALTVGFEGQGGLNLAETGRLTSGDAFVGRMTGSSGTMFVGAGSSWTVNGRLSLGGDADTGVAGGSAAVQFDGGVVDVAEEIVLFAGSFLHFTDGVLDAPEITFLPGGNFDWVGGELFVEEVHAGGLNNQGGVLATRAGSNTIVIDGEYTQGPGGVLSIEIGGSAASGGYDSVVVGNTAFLNGRLEVEIADAFQPAPDDVYVVMDALNFGLGSFTNGSSGSRIRDSSGRGSFLISYGVGSPFDPSQVVLSDFQPHIDADFDDDGDVDGDDLQQWRGDFGVNEFSDADGDGDSDGRDLLVWQQQLGRVPPAAPVATVVPEPDASWLLLPVASLLMLRLGEVRPRGDRASRANW